MSHSGANHREPAAPTRNARMDSYHVHGQRTHRARYGDKFRGRWERPVGEAAV